MKNWPVRSVILIMAVAGCFLSMQYAASHFRSERQIILLNRTLPDFHDFLNVENQLSTSIPKDVLKGYFDYFHIVTEAMPENSDGRLMLAYLEETNGNKKRAEALLRDAYRLDPQFFFTEFDLAVILFDRGDYQQSALLLQKALAIPPENTLNRMMGSTIYRQVLSSVNDNGQIIAGLRRAYNDAYVLLIESLAKQKGITEENGPQIYAHVM